MDDIAIPSDSESIFQELGITPEVLLRQARLVSFYIIDWAVNDKTGEAVFSATVPAGYISNKPFDAPEVSGFTRSAFLSVSGNFTYFPTGQRFAVQPLRYSPRYHIIYEFDQEKRYAVNMDSEDFEFSDEDRLKIRKHKEFYNRLPRDEINKKVIGDFK